MAQRIFITGSLFGVRVFGSAPSQTAGGGTPKGVQGSSASSTSASAVAGPACPPEMMRVPGGAITGGGRATIMVESFCMDVSEVTVKAYAACLKRGKCTPAHASAKWPETGIDPSALLAVACNQGHGDRQEHPINCVDWSQANAFCTSSGKALPTDAQWDWAAHRGSARTKRPWGDDAPLLQVCWSNFTRRASTCPVASYIAGDNPWAIHDLEGNVREWTATSIGDDRLLCGIAWHDTRESISAVRDDCGRALKTGRAPFVGFRCVTE